VSTIRTQDFFYADEGSIEDQLQCQLQREVHDQRLRLRRGSVCGTAASLLPTGKITTVTAAASRAYIRIGLVQFVAAPLYQAQVSQKADNRIRSEGDNLGRQPRHLLPQSLCSARILTGPLLTKWPLC
jgi:hypothetical protein